MNKYGGLSALLDAQDNYVMDLIPPGGGAFSLWCWFNICLYNAMWWFEYRRRRIVCFFKGHVIMEGESVLAGEVSYKITPNWCDRCLRDEDDFDLKDKPAWWYPLNRLYIHICDQEWAWFENIDLWLREHFDKHLPDWWVY